MIDGSTISRRKGKRRMKDKGGRGREGRLSKHVEAASFHVKRAAHSTKSCTCATPDSAASFGSRMNYRPVRGWALSFPVHAVAPSFPPCPHPLTRRPALSFRSYRPSLPSATLPPPPPPIPTSSPHHQRSCTTAPLSIPLFFFHFQRKDTVPCIPLLPSISNVFLFSFFL